MRIVATMVLLSALGCGDDASTPSPPRSTPSPSPGPVVPPPEPSIPAAPEPAAPRYPPTAATGHGRQVRVVFRTEGETAPRGVLIPMNACLAGGTLFVSDSAARITAVPLQADDEERGEPTAVEHEDRILSFDCDAETLFYGRDSALRSHRLGHGARTLASAPEDPLHVLLDHDHVLFDLFRGRGVFRVASEGGDAERIAATATRPGPLAVDDAYVYFTEYRAGTVSRAPLEGGRIEVIARGQPRPIGIAVDETHVYWGTETDGSVRRAPKSGGAPERLAVDQHNHDELELRDGHLYWYSWGSGELGHTFVRVPVDGGPVEVLVSRLSSPSDIIVADRVAFVVNKAAGEVLEVEL